jgi:hypothetical protein
MLLEYMEKLTTYSPDLELCYCNIDSIHFSVPASQVDGALSLLRERTSSDMGDLRIEAISRHGLWLEPGRYWLYDDAVSKFSNSGIGDGVQPFKEKRIGVSTRKIDGLHVPVRLSVSLANSMSDIHGLRWDSVAGLFRQRSAEVTAGMAYGDVLEMLEGNRREAIPVKLQAFQLLKQRLHPEA